MEDINFYIFELVENGLSPKQTADGRFYRVRHGEGWELRVFQRSKDTIDQVVGWRDKLFFCLWKRAFLPYRR
ncbi:hypothetical protein PFISCL1PPCAC_17236 [Pristionchus fissidentatus]|uniref:ETS domain-containing protein n=1 Tax=Pristionchus fissidentatus TaxID=1538716 RepID=A0AAV5W206_9BILA|nr:hypothetical protein PFISCL1PPCAC_17236 [Pristionchus fissidentatus]